MYLVSFNTASAGMAQGFVRRAVFAAGVIIAIGFAIRIYASIHSMGIVHADEHQQYMEQANRISYGYGQTYWEQERGMRNYVYPGALAGCLFALEACGLSDPIAQAAAIRFVLSSFNYVVLIAVAWRYYRTGNRVAAAAFLVWVSVSPVMIFLSVRTLSETAVIAPFFLALLFLARRPATAGILFGICIAVRFQTAILIVPVFSLLFGECILSAESDRQKKMGWLLAGFAMAMLAIGGLDRLTLGSWFHSPVEYFRANILENKSADYGVEPWDYYFELIEAVFLTFTFVGTCLLVGSISDWRLAIVSVVFLTVHSAIGHKEDRFLWCLVPMAYLLAANGLQIVCRLLEGRTCCAIVMGLAACGAIWGEFVEFPQLQWNSEPFRSSALALTDIGRRPDVTGVAILGASRSSCGNQFYLRRQIQLAFKDDYEPARQFLANNQSVNYLVAYSELSSDFNEWRPERVGSVAKAFVYRLSRAFPTQIPARIDQQKSSGNQQESPTQSPP